MHGDEDCFAARLATAFRTRFATAALDMAALRLVRAEADHNIVKIDLFTAVTVILRDRYGVFARSRRRRTALLPFADPLEDQPVMTGSGSSQPRGPIRAHR